MDTYLFLLDDAGELQGENDDIDADGDNYNSRITVTLPTGDYIVEATTYPAMQTGTFILSIAPSDE